MLQPYPGASRDTVYRLIILKGDLDAIEWHVIKYEEIDDCRKNQNI